MNDIAIKVDHINKSFRLPHDKQNSLKGGLISIVKGGKRTYETQEVLKDITFEIKKGEFFGIVGRNGSGKSTLLKLLAGIYIPTSGFIQVNGPLTPFIELGVGFNPELTGRENVFLNGALLGFSRDEMSEMYDDIVEFAELERFMDQKLKNYSSGMQVRLAFSIAIRAQSSILLLDEVLAVGDAIFQKKCYDYFRQLKKNGHTVILVSHDYSILEQYCDKGILIEKGRIIKEGKIQEVVTSYIDIISTDSAEKVAAKPTGHVGSGEVHIDSVKLPVTTFGYDPENIIITMNATAQKDIEFPIFGISIVNESDYPIFSSNNLWLKQPIENLKAGQSVELTFEVPNIFNNGKHSINAAVATDNGKSIVDRIEKITSFTIKNKLPNGSYTNPQHKMIIKVKN